MSRGICVLAAYFPHWGPSMGLWSRLFHRDAPAPLRLRDLARRVDDLESDLEALHHQLKKLRGRVTGGLRAESQPEGQPEPSAPVLVQEPNHQTEIENGRLLLALRGQRGLLPR